MRSGERPYGVVAGRAAAHGGPADDRMFERAAGSVSASAGRREVEATGSHPFAKFEADSLGAVGRLVTDRSTAPGTWSIDTSGCPSLELISLAHDR